MKKRVLSGIQPTGRLHLGNLIGAVENWVKLQDQYECFFFIADLHALTTGYTDVANLKSDIRNLTIDLLAAGLDPKKAVIFKQSDLAEHSQLHLLLSMITPVSWLERVPTYKSKIEELTGKDLGTYGFLGYPVLQAADILMYQADFVPVGQDQLPHIELTREIARRFNNFYGEVFRIPQDLLTKFPVLPGTDGRKMSKSYGNTIALSDPADVVAKKVAEMVTDPARVKKSDPGHPEVCSAFAFYQVFAGGQKDGVASECRGGQRGCVECKRELAGYVQQHLAPLQVKRAKLENDDRYLEKVLADGANRARRVAAETLLAAEKAVNLK